MPIRFPLLPLPLRWTAVLAIAGFIFYASIFTVPPTTAVDTFRPEFVPLDKWRHVVAYAAFAYALAYAIADSDLDHWRAALLVIGVAILYGTGIEVGQYFLAHRVFDLNDIVANAIGASLVLVWYLVRPRLELVPVAEWL